MLAGGWDEGVNCALGLDPCSLFAMAARVARADCG